MRLAFEFKDKMNFGEIKNNFQRDIPALLATIGLVHDLGNPPFGHQGEKAIQSWFKKNQYNVFGESIEPFANDFLMFDGNAQTFRLVTKLQILNDNFGLNLTYATLASMLKYPISVKNLPHVTWKKHGFFLSEESIVSDIWDVTGLRAGIRHPMTYIMEACDDIAYSVLDAEDIVKKGLASFYDLINHLRTSQNDPKNTEAQKNIIEEVIEKSSAKNAEYMKENLSPAELNDMSMQMFRVFSISALVKCTVNHFIENIELYLNSENTEKDIISKSDAGALCASLKCFDTEWGYKHKSVLKLELEGHNYINSIMDMLWIGIHGRLQKEHASMTPFGRYAYQKISENYRRIFEDKTNVMPICYKEAQLLTDAISGMTDNYLITLHNELKSLYDCGRI